MGSNKNKHEGGEEETTTEDPIELLQQIKSLKQIIVDKDEAMDALRQKQSNIEKTLTQTIKVQLYYRDKVEHYLTELIKLRGGDPATEKRIFFYDMKADEKQQLEQLDQLEDGELFELEGQLKQRYHHQHQQQQTQIKQENDEDADDEDEDADDEENEKDDGDNDDDDEDDMKEEEVILLVIRENTRLQKKIQEISKTNKNIYNTFKWSGIVLNNLLNDRDKQRGFCKEYARLLRLSNAELVRLQNEKCSLLKQSRHQITNTDGLSNLNDDDGSLSKTKADLDVMRKQLDALWIAHAQKYDTSRNDCAQKEKQERRKGIDQIRHKLETWQSMEPKDVTKMKALLDRKEFEDFVHNYISKACNGAIFRLDREVAMLKSDENTAPRAR